jgi:hypothetical protein
MILFYTVVYEACNVRRWLWRKLLYNTPWGPRPSLWFWVYDHEELASTACGRWAEKIDRVHWRAECKKLIKENKDYSNYL